MKKRKDISKEKKEILLMINFLSSHMDCKEADRSSRGEFLLILRDGQRERERGHEQLKEKNQIFS